MSRSSRWFHVRSGRGAVESAALPIGEDAHVLRDPELSPRDWATFLLHTAAEIEHSLLVQYLYAGYSIRSDADPFRRWRRTVLAIAREEMGHLLTLQNILWLIGGPSNFERQDFPYRSQFYPFEFHLEPMTKSVLAKYVVAEMPDPVPEEVMAPAERDGLLFVAGVSTGAPINHVGLLYRELVRLFSAAGELPDSVFRTDRDDFQEPAAEWRAEDTDVSLEGVQVFTVSDRASVLRALYAIGRQGESPDASDMTASHFERFLEIYRAYGDDVVATLRIAVNPSTDRNATKPMTRIVDPVTLSWARLANLRYRELLLLIAHVVLRSTSSSPEVSTLLRTRIFDVMVGAGSIREIAKKLTALDVAGASGIKAGVPFELPYTLAQPPEENDRWRLYLDVLSAETDLAAKIGAELDAMVASNRTWQKIIEDNHFAD